MKNFKNTPELLPSGKFSAPNRLPSAKYRKDSEFNYFHTVLIAMFITIPSFGLVKGILTALIWPLILIAMIFN